MLTGTFMNQPKAILIPELFGARIPQSSALMQMTLQGSIDFL